MIWELLQTVTYYDILLAAISCSNCSQRISSILQHPWACSFLMITTNVGMPETMRQLCQEYWCKLPSSVDSLLLLFWLTFRVDSITTTIFSRVSSWFLNDDILPWFTSTSFVNSKNFLVGFRFAFIFWEFRWLGSKFFTFFAHIVLYLVTCLCVLFFFFLYSSIIVFDY